MKVSIEEEYTSVACNRTPEIADWNSDDVICYGATNAVVLYKTSQANGNPISVRSHHRSKVYSVKWLCKNDGSSTEFISCSADKTAAIWTLVNGEYKVTGRLEGHTEGVTAIAGVYNGNDLTVFTASIDSTIKVWERRNGTTTLTQTISLNSGLCLTLCAHVLHSSPLLICGLDDHKVHLFGKGAGGNGDTEEYHRLHTLVGHEDWVRGLDVLDVDENTILLASCSQDTYVRLWRIQLYLPDMDQTAGMKVEQRVFMLGGRQYSARLDAVLAGHEGWVYGVQWAPTGIETSLRLLSSSLDKTLIIWEPGSDGVWTERARLGAAGGHGLGFYGGRWGPEGNAIMGHSYNGAFHIWRYNEETTTWQPSITCGGHFGAVEDARWEPEHGSYLATVSADQTTRVHGRWKKDDGSSQWHELSRPQVHGYDMASLALVSADTFASAAEEKVVRVFKAPHNFVTNFQRITGEVFDGVANGGGPEGASVPSLGLSNKAVFSDDDTQEGDEDGYFVPVTMTEPPTEDTLVQNTLWPETNKLYGHGFEVFALDASRDGRLLASACRASTAEHASVIIWETKTWQQIQKLTSHTLTVTQLAFSPDSTRLLSVSRDRRWTLFQREEGGNSFEIAAVTDKSNGVHSRIIWCCAWAQDGEVFATGSRDGKICVWTKTNSEKKSSLGNYGLLRTPLEVKNSSVTALAFFPSTIGANRVVAAGFESGKICVYGFGESGWSSLFELDNSAAHHLTVRRLVFRPRGGEGGEGEGALASCGDDNLVRIYKFCVTDT